MRQYRGFIGDRDWSPRGGRPELQIIDLCRYEQEDSKKLWRDRRDMRVEYDGMDEDEKGVGGVDADNRNKTLQMLLGLRHKRRLLGLKNINIIDSLTRKSEGANGKA